MVCTLLAGVNVVAFAADGDSDTTIAIQKFYNDAKKGGDGEHLFTKDADEMRWLATLPTWNNEGEAWKAPVTSSEAVYRCYNPNSGEHLYVDEGYADYLAGSGWNKEKLAFYSDDNMGTPVYRLWNGQDGVGSHHFTTDAGEVEWLVGQGWIAEDVAFYGVKEEYSDVIQLVDRSGIQADGTALKGDTLAVVFGSDLGIPAKVVWYCNGAVISVYDTELTEASFAKVAYMTGSWSVQVENTAGKVFKTNAITVVDEGVALMDDVNIADYTDAFSNKKDVAAGQNIVYQTYAQQDTKAVISADLNKVYGGEFALYKASDVASGDFKKANPVDTWSVGNFIAGSGSQITVPSQFTDKTAIEKAYDAAGGTQGAWIENNDGSYSFKLLSKNVGVTRGEKYVLAFWQTGHDDAPVSVADPFEAPYLPAPKAVTISDCTTASGAITASMTFWADEEMTEELEYLGDKANATTAAALGIGVDMFASKTNNLNKDANMAFRAGTYIEAGKSETYAAAVNINDYVGVWGTAKTTQGIYGKSSTTLKTTLAPLPAESAQSMGIEYSVSDPYDLKVSFTGLKTDGVVLVARTTTNAAVEVQAANLKLLSDPTSAVGMAQVTKGTKSIDVENVVDDIYNTTRTQGDFYTAVFVPSDPTTFAVESTLADGNAKAMANVTPQMAMIDLDEDEEFETVNTNAAITAESSGTILVAIDQFGEEIGPKTNVSASSASAVLVSEAVSQDLGVSFETDANGYLVVSSTKAPVDIGAQKMTQVGDAYSLKVSPLQTLVMTCTDIEYDANNIPTHIYWTFSVK